MVWPTALRAFRYRDFRLFWTGQLVSLVGSWMQSVGQAWIVLELTHSPFKLGVISALQFGPMLFLSFLAGALADRVRKRRLLLLTQSALMLQACAGHPRPHGTDPVLARRRAGHPLRHRQHA